MSIPLYTRVLFERKLDLYIVHYNVHNDRRLMAIMMSRIKMNTADISLIDTGVETPCARENLLLLAVPEPDGSSLNLRSAESTPPDT